MGSTMMKNQAVLQIAEQYHATAYQILLAWVMQQPDVLAIPKSSSSEHLLSNLKALEIELTQEDLQTLDQAYPKPDHKEPLAIY